MALFKEVTLANGVSAGHWKISKIETDIPAMTITFTLSLYLDDTQKIPLRAQKKCTAKIANLALFSTVLAAGYNRVKELANSEGISLHPLESGFKELAGAVDV